MLLKLTFLQVRMLASGLVENMSITHLNISHNKVRVHIDIDTY
jgi:hypothetical protein